MKQLLQKCSESDESHVVFDRYDVELSLKSATRIQRQGGQDPVYYRITESTHMGKVPMKKLLTHNKAKMELSEYLAGKALDHAEIIGKCLVAAWGTACEATHKNVAHLRSTQEEVDTKILLHAVVPAAHGATKFNIHSPDTAVFILSLRRYPQLCHETNFITGTGQRHRVIKLQPIVPSLSTHKIATLLAILALSGADNTGSLAGKGKATWWKAFQEASQDIIIALANLGASEPTSAETMAAIEKLICKLYVPNTTITTVKHLQYWLFKKKQAQSENLPPTQAAPEQTVMRAYYQAMVWNNDIVPQP